MWQHVPMRRLLPALFLLVLAAAAPVPLAGVYMLTGVREAAGGLELKPDGSFIYGHSYGALDEQAEGKWRQEGNRIYLTTLPKPRPPSFTVKSAEPGTAGLFEILLESPQGKPIPNIDFEITFADGNSSRSHSRSDWMEAPLDEAHLPVSLVYRIPVFGVESQPIPIETKKARRYRIVLDPADLGVKNFDNTPLDIRDDILAPEGAPEGVGFKRVKD